METYLSYSNILSGISLVVLMMAVLLMFRIYKNMNGKLYSTIWWTSISLLLVFTISDGVMAYCVWFDRLSEIENVLGVAMICSAFFTMVVVYAGYVTTNDLKSINISKRYLDKVMESMSSYLVVTDAKFKIKKVNAAICRELGVGKDSLVGSHVSSIFVNSDLSDLVENYSEQMEAFIENKEGGIKSVLLSGEPIFRSHGRRKAQIHGFVFQAFTNHQKEMQHLYSFFRSILNNSEYAIVATDTFGTVTGMNPAVENYFGYREEEVKNQLSPDIFHSKECIEKFAEENNISCPEPGFSLLTNSIDSGHPISREMMMVKRDGTPFPALITVNAIKNGGETIGYFEIIVDISAKRDAEEALKKANSELKDFAHIVSHDLKAPLRAIGTLAAWLKEDYGTALGEEGREQLTLLMGRVTRMEGLINGILEYSRVGQSVHEQNMEDLNLVVVDVLDAVVPKKKFNFVMDKPLPPVKIDRTRAQQIFQNIISNSVKYMDKEIGEIKVACEAEGPFWKISISDNGPGIEKQYFDKIFQIFQTLKPRDEYESTGVGLAIVKKSVELYGGKVWLESALEKGTTFFFTLPQN
ncbi:MAG: ATP-binding protein [Reichenbachiella sp.]|uniref:ATP-binding protein n=1 Tax=Reichenbachiella sp. TaxID=2184521 RepID=UPI0032658595